MFVLSDPQDFRTHARNDLLVGNEFKDMIITTHPNVAVEWAVELRIWKNPDSTLDPGTGYTDRGF
jgi:hypothetical protein